MNSESESDNKDNTDNEEEEEYDEENAEDEGEHEDEEEIEEDEEQVELLQKKPSASRGQVAEATLPVAVSLAKSAATAPVPAKQTLVKPSTKVMVDTALMSLNERMGSSVIAIQKYVVANYNVDPAKFRIFIKKYLKNGVASGKLIQTKGTGATGSFKIAPERKVTKKLAKEKSKGKEKKETKKEPERKNMKEKVEKTNTTKKKPKTGKTGKTADEVTPDNPKKPTVSKRAKPVSTEEEDVAVPVPDAKTSTKSSKSTASKPKETGKTKASRKLEKPAKLERKSIGLLVKPSVHPKTTVKRKLGAIAAPKAKATAKKAMKAKQAKAEEDDGSELEDDEDDISEMIPPPPVKVKSGGGSKGKKK